MAGLGASTPLLGQVELVVIPPIEATVAEGIGMFAGAGLGRTLIDTLAEGIGSHLVQVVGQVGISLDDIGVIPVPGVIRAQPATATGGIGVHGVATPTRGQVLLEHIAVTLAQVDNYKYHLTTTTGVGVDELLLQGRSVTLTSGVGIALAQQAVLSLQIIEELGLLSAMAPLLKYHKTTSETIGIADELSRFLGGHLADGLGIAPTQVATAAKAGRVSEGIGIAPASAPHLILRVTVANTIGLDDVNVLRMLYKPVLSEGIELSAAYLAPNGNITTWVMNTRTAAVTEYSNYAFNSFAKLGDKYLGASDAGLYELVGDDDAGTDIIADIKSGFAQWAGLRYTMFKGVYLGLRGDGDWVLKLTTGDDKTYNYAVSTTSMTTTKVRTGKGLRARYFAFELISTGQDFDLDTIEFVPLVADRRV